MRRALVIAAALALWAAPAAARETIKADQDYGSTWRALNLLAPTTPGEPVRRGDMPGSGLPCAVVFTGGSPLFRCAVLGNAATLGVDVQAPLSPADGSIVMPTGSTIRVGAVPGTSVTGTPNTIPYFNGSGVLNALTLSPEFSLSAGTLSLASGSIAPSKLQNEAAGTLLGNSGASPAPPAAVSILPSLSLSASGLGLASVPAGTPVLGELVFTAANPSTGPPAGFGRCRYDATNLTWTCLSAFGGETHGVATSTGANFITGIWPDGHVTRSGVSANQVAGLWPVALTGNGSDLNPASTPLDRLSQSGATSGQVPSWNGTAWVPTTPSAGSTTPTGTGFYHVTGGAMDPAARAVDLSTSDTINSLSTSRLTGLLPCSLLNALTGDVTSGGGSCATTVANISNGATWSGWQHPTNTTVAGTPAAGTSNVWVDSTAKTLFVKDDAGNVSHGIRTTTATAGQFVTSFNDNGTANLGTPTGDHKVLVNASDTTPGYLADKITALVPSVVAPAGALAPPTSGLVFWVNGATGVGTSGGSNVVSWADQSGHGNNVTTAAGTPVLISGGSGINGQPVVRFNNTGGSAASCYLSGALTLSGGTGLTVLYVARTAASGTIPQFNTIVSWHSGGVWWAFNQGSDTLTSQGAGWAGSAGAVAFGNATSIPTNGQTLFAGYLYDKTQWTLDTINSGTYADTSYPTSAVLLLVGTDAGTARSQSTSDVAEILIYDHKLSSTDLATVKGYLALRYNITIAGAAAGSSLQVSTLYDNASLTLNGSNQLQRAAVTGDGTIAAGSNTFALSNIPSGTTAAGTISFTPIAAPATPAAGHALAYVDSTSKVLSLKNDAGTVSHGVQTLAASTHLFLTGIGADGLPSRAQPDYSDLTGTPSSLPPSGAAGGALTGSYPNPSIANGVIVPANFAAFPAATLFGNDQATSATPRTITLGTGLAFDSTAHALNVTVASGADALGTYWVSSATHAPANATIMSGLGTGVLEQTVSGGVATPTAVSVGSKAIVVGISGGGGVTSDTNFQIDTVAHTLTATGSASFQGATTTIGAWNGIGKYTAGVVGVASHPGDYLSEADMPAATDLMVSGGTTSAPVGYSTLTADGNGVVTMTGVTGGNTIKWRRVGDQQFDKSGGTFWLGTSDLNDVSIYTNNSAARVAFKSTGELNFMSLAAPATPATGRGSCWFDATANDWTCKDSSGNVSHGARSVSAGAGFALTGLSDSGVWTTTAFQTPISFPPSTYVTVGTGTGITGYSNFTYDGNVLTMSGVSGGNTINWNRAGDQQFNKSGGTFWLGTSDAHPVSFYTNNSTARLSLEATVPNVDQIATTTGATYQWWKDSTPTKAMAIGNSVPGTAVTNNMVFSAYTGSAWVQGMALTNAAVPELILGDTVQLNGLAASALMATDSGRFASSVVLDPPVYFSGGHLGVTTPTVETFAWSESWQNSGTGLPATVGGNTYFVIPSGNLGVAQVGATDTFVTSAGVGTALNSQYGGSTYPSLYAVQRSTTSGQFTCSAWYGAGSLTSGSPNSDVIVFTLNYTTNPGSTSVTQVATGTTSNITNARSVIINQSVGAVPVGAYVFMEFHRTDANSGWKVTGINFNCQATLW